MHEVKTLISSSTGNDITAYNDTYMDTCMNAAYFHMISQLSRW